MSTIETPDHETPGVTAPDLAHIEISTLHRAEQMNDVVHVFQQVWGTTDELVSIEMLMAISHAGGYVSGAYDTHGESGRMVGASVGILARHLGLPALHSHITGLLPGARHSGVGRALKLHQRAWAAEHGIEWIVWTFDPLVRRNAWFNLAVLGAEVHEYLPSFYGSMTDAINAGDESDRLLMAWHVDGEVGSTLRDGTDIAGAELVPTPDDIVTLRRTDPAEVARWRRTVREALTAALAAGRPVVGFTRAGEYVIGPPR